MPAPRGSVAALLLLAVVLCAAQGAITRHEATSDTGATLSLSQRQLAGLSPRVVRAAEDESSGEQQQVVGDLNKQTLAAEDDDNDVADKGLAPAGDVAGAETGAGAGTDAAAPPEVLVPADPSGGGRARGHYHYHDKAGCFGYGYGRRRPNIIVINNPNNDNNGDSGDPDSEQLRQAPRSRRGRSRGRRAAPASSATAPGDAPHFNLWLYPAAVKRSRAARASLDHRLGVSTEVLLPYRPYALQRKTVNDLDFNDLDHRKLESRLEDDGRERVKREAEDPEGADDNEVEVVPEPSLLDYSIKDLVKRCVNAIVGGSSGKSSNGAVSIARDGVAVGRAAVEGGIQVARMIVQAFRELGASPSLVGDMEPSQQGLPDLDADALSGLEARELTRDRRDAIQNVRKNLKNKAEIIMSRSNDIAEKVNDKMDSLFGDSPVYVKAKETIMGAVGKVIQTAAKVSSSTSSRRRRRRAAEEDPITTKPPRPRKGMAAILARVLEDMDNIPGRRVAKMVSTPLQPESEPLEDPDEPAAAPTGAQGEAADLLAPRREKRAAGAIETTTAALEDERDATEESVEEDHDVALTESKPEKGGQDIGKELGVRRRRRDASPASAGGAVRLRRDLMEDVRNATERFMQRGREMFMKAKEAFEQAMKKAQEAAKGRSGGGAGPAAPSAPPEKKPEKPSDNKPEKPSEIPDEPEEDLSDDAEETKPTSRRRRSLPDSDATGIFGKFKTEVRLTESIA